jgi:hypothetical protein
MVNTGNGADDVPQQYATAVEVDGIRRTLDKFMKDQETQNSNMNSSLDKLLRLAEISGAKLQDTTAEDKGSNTKGKNTSTSYQVPQLRKPDSYMQKKVNFAATSSNLAQKQLPHQYSSQYQPWSQDGNLDDDQYTEFGEVHYYDLEQDEEEHTWNLQDHEEPFIKPTNIPSPNTTPNPPPNYPNPSHTNNYPRYTTSNHQNSRGRNFQPINQYQQNQQTNPHYNYNPPPNYNYNQHLHFQHKAVARGPKLNFPEFSGEDVEGWIRKAEKYFELVGVPTEDRVQIAIMYISGKAEYWWRGTRCNASTLPWHHFCRMAGDRFNTISEYEIVGQFHNLKQVGTVIDYVDRFEEMVSMVKRHNPSLADNYFISSFISGLKDTIQYHVQCHKPTSLSQAIWFAKRQE